MIDVNGIPRSKHSAYPSWAAMKNRCFRKVDSSYDQYGGRGITVCDWWMDFRNFAADMGPRPEGKTIHRLDNDKGYYPKNCVWATRKEQAQHKRDNRLITYQGETRPLSMWAERYNINYDVLYFRIIRGWPVEDALKVEITPHQGKRPNGNRLMRKA